MIKFFGSFTNDLFPDESPSQDIVFLKIILAAIAALAVAYLINRIINRSVPKIAHLITINSHPKRMKANDRLLRRRRAETLLGVAAAIGRLTVTVICLYIAWRVVNPTSAPLALIGASTFFIVLGAATVGPLLRDLTNGVLMIAEKWYNVGDHIVVDPFWELSGVVEKVNLRSTKLRSLGGEVVWIHNQHIQAVRVTSKGVRTISIDTFVNDLERGRKLIENVINIMPRGQTMIPNPIVISEEEKLGDIWRITAVGQTPLGREWLIEDFAVKAILKSDRESKPHHIIEHGPIVRYTDIDAEKRFVRSMIRTTPENG